MNTISKQRAVWIFLVFAFAYFISTLIRAITATLSPILIQDFGLSPQDLGLLAGAYFLGFSLTQLPLGAWLDKMGPKKVVLSFMSVAVFACIGFATAYSFQLLWLARFLVGVGVSACLMGPLTAYRKWFDPSNQMRANSWMLMTGALGMVASTLPVQWLLPQIGWRPIFLILSGLIVLAIVLIYLVVPKWPEKTINPESVAETPIEKMGYSQILKHPYFIKNIPLGLFVYGGLVAIQTLWAVPWMIKVAAYTPIEASTGLFWLNVSMLLTFWLWGLVGPKLAQKGITAVQIISYGLPLSFVTLATIVFTAGQTHIIGIPIWVYWTLYCVFCTSISSAQPAIAMAFPSEVAGRALSAYNLTIFFGVFVVQWGVGLLIDLFSQMELSVVDSYSLAIGIYGAIGVFAYLFFLFFYRQQVQNIQSKMA